MKTMRAIVCDRPGDESVMRIGEVEAPPLRPGAIRIAVEAAGVNRADLLQRQGFYPPPPGASPLLGLECAGVVTEVAADVRGWSVGDAAMALLSGGGYAEQVVVSAGSALPVPAGISIEQAAAIPEVFLTVFLNVFQLGKLERGGSLLVHGGGSGIGTAAIQLAREAGARCIVTAGSDEKCERCLALGAAAAINYRSGDFAAPVLRASGERGVDVILDSIGASYLDANLRCLALGGRLIVIGLMGGNKAELSLAQLLTRRLSIIGSTLRTRSDEEKASIAAGFAERFGAALAAQRVGPVVDRVLPLEAAGDAHRAMKASEHFGKIVLRVRGRSGADPTR
jgi:putative PIG3 family NAD(P)H quinone oxidoreductase